MLGMAPDYDSLTIVQKVGISQAAMSESQHTSCQVFMSASVIKAVGCWQRA